MPAVFRHKGFRFFFYSNEGYPREPLHIHARKGEAIAKFWLEPDVSLAESYDLTSSELRELMDAAEKNKEHIKRYWNEYFGE
ncbi:MAG: DUF4160 domain-containing protein [Candidatus Aminicenantes bacterium]|nr:DUF4160 domain-containing protein [Candidatus Aminicenantes bacterium]